MIGFQIWVKGREHSRRSWPVLPRVGEEIALPGLYLRVIAVVHEIDNGISTEPHTRVYCKET
jgi:hypothetical protein